MSDRDEPMPAARQHFNRRALVVAGAQVIAFSVLGGRLFQLQVQGASHYLPLADENRFDQRPLSAKRGRILDAFGRPLADNDDVFRAVLTPALAKDVPEVLSRVRRIVAMSDEDVARLVRRGRRHGRNAQTIIATDISFEQVAKLGLYAPVLPGVSTEVSWRRRYHGGAAVGPVVGWVGAADGAKITPDLAKFPDVKVGKGGAEGAFDTALKGDVGFQKVEVNARGRVVRTIETIEPVAGSDVTLSIDVELEQAIWARMAKEKVAAAVVIDVATGEIAAMSSTPSIDPADIVVGTSSAQSKQSVEDGEKSPLNRAVAGQYAPGSIFKLVTGLAALEAGVATADERVKCSGHFDYDGQALPCWKATGHGEVTLLDALRYSCDVYFFEMARRVGIAKIADVARRLGFGSVSGASFADEYAGNVPDPGSALVSASDALRAGIGQGSVLATPLQLAVATARIAGGRALTPTLLRADRQSPRVDFKPLNFNDAHLDCLRRGMIAAVNEDGGTGVSAKLGAGRPTVAGKTGSSDVSKLTSEGREDDLAWEKRDHALFVAYVPADAPRYAIATVVEHGASGGATAAPLARDILIAVLDRDARLRTGSGTGAG